MISPTTGGVLRITRELMMDFISDLITGKKRLINKNLILRGITRLNDDVPLFCCAYDFAFTADDLPVIPEGCCPNPDLDVEEVKGKKNCYKLVQKK